MKTLTYLALLNMIAFLACSPMQQDAVQPQPPAIIPQPVQMEVMDGAFELSANTAIAYSEQDENAKVIAEMLNNMLHPVLGQKLQYGDDQKNAIRFVKDSSIENAEGYRLNVDQKGITLSARSGAGYFYGVQTLRQLLENSDIRPSNKVMIPWLKINDHPRFEWRGMMLDVSRHFFPKDFIKKFIDYLAMNKLNTFHWHLVDDQGWRIEIKKYPLLTEKGAWRVNKENLHWNSRSTPEEGEVADFGGFYTQEEIREIVKYAAERHVTIVPEIEMPAHVSAAISAYPWLSCKQEPIPVPSGGVWPITDIYCAGNDSTFMFLEDVLTEVMDLFPSQYIHVGGDEATKTAWEQCPKCQRRIKTEGLSDVHELQSYFISRVEQFLNANGRRLIGWDEILEGGLAPNATVMSWRGMNGGIEAAKEGHKAVMSPGTHLYFDHYQGQQQLEPPAFGGYSPISHVYTFDPAPDSLGEAVGYILGGQANLWTEYVPTPEHAEYMIFPRIYALAEVLWTPKEKKDWDNFIDRVNRHLPTLDKMGVNYAKSMNNVDIVPVFNETEKTISMRMEAENPKGDIYYTTDGSEPDAESEKYASPLFPGRTMQIKAGLFQGDQLAGKISTTQIFIHQAFGMKPQQANPPAEKYSGNNEFVLTDGIRANLNFGSGQWQGFNGKDMEAVFSFDNPVIVKKVRVGALHDYGSWIFRPNQVTVYGSKEGNIYELLGKTQATLPVTTAEKQIVHFDIQLSGQQFSKIKIVVDNIGTCPEGHSGEGSSAWLFVDEIIIE
ncbi:family 20 glycosylhydrolase [Fulvivirga ulvae]|uniref:beta-N-acetylhexosaminidase n=1 Tax=Fulvivirga ulvae TaxID=2904245 RepID=UPI001F3F7EF3|nr:family 20 glycosylhydrolase [Fulvivirga ulvae]UII32696.1 family 20 glycosylhydrolase [Fulvivirga ulvae]